MLFLYAVAKLLLVKGIGIWGVNIPVGWGFAIVNFVWWIGIGHAGTLISAILLLLRQRWRTSINRFAEAMTLFAVSCAGLYPILHLGRPWLFYWLFPYPEHDGAVAAVPQPADVGRLRGFDLRHRLAAVLVRRPDSRSGDPARPRHAPRARSSYGMLAMGWRGSARHWHRYETASLLLAGLATPLVVSVHTIVSFDFAVSIVPGWHATIFPPYFVAGAIYSGFAMVMTLAIPLRYVYGLEDFITSALRRTGSGSAAARRTPAGSAVSAIAGGALRTAPEGSDASAAYDDQTSRRLRTPAQCRHVVRHTRVACRAAGRLCSPWLQSDPPTGRQWGGEGACGSGQRR